MAQMIPAVVAPKTPYSERGVFERLQLDPATSDWIVLHSLGLSKTKIGPHGEVDFVVLVPGAGVLCLEVKGGKVSCSQGLWKTVNTKTGKVSIYNKSPYLQARENMFALMKKIKSHFGKDHPICGAIFSYAVVFPSVLSPPETPETEKWETFDIESLRKPVSGLVLWNLKSTKKKLGRGVKKDSVSQQTMEALRKFLHPDFERVIVRSATIAVSEEQLVSLTEEQYYYLDIASVNRRTLITGAAGTGKTVLALEHARREAIEGQQVLFLCYNKMLANWLLDFIKNSQEKLPITVSTFDAYLKRAVEHSQFRNEYKDACEGQDISDIFREICPLYAELVFTETGADYDTLIIDEAQDLLNETNLSVLNVLVKGGLAGARWAFFGDFTRQSIYGSAELYSADELARDLLRSFSPYFSVVPLQMNCRNTRQIGEETALLSGFDSLPYRLGRVDGLAVDYRYWKTADDQAKQLKRVIRKLIEDAVSPTDIIILGSVRLEKSIVSKISADLPFPITTLMDGSGKIENKIIYSTIHAFKGMESPVVILIGISDIESDSQRSLLYVGMSRARSHLIVLMNESVRKLIPGLTAKKLRADWKV